MSRNLARPPAEFDDLLGFEFVRLLVHVGRCMTVCSLKMQAYNLYTLNAIKADQALVLPEHCTRLSLPHL